jgi:hypothetical protein
MTFRSDGAALEADQVSPADRIAAFLACRVWDTRRAFVAYLGDEETLCVHVAILYKSRC